MSNPPTRLARLAPAAACAALAVALLWPALTPELADRLYIGGGGEDFLRQVYPWRAFVAATWAGEDPALEPAPIRRHARAGRSAAGRSCTRGGCCRSRSRSAAGRCRCGR
ncbi:MAG: hypothetical protein U0470_08575 [Anaerolineae bacterium]